MDQQPHTGAEFLPLRWLLVVLIITGLDAALAAPAFADEQYEHVQIVDSYLELHTGPGRGYPITQVVERGEWVEILKRRTDWFKIRTSHGKEGWAVRAQMETTLTEAGVQTTFRDVLLEDYLKRRFEVGFAGGVLESDPLMLARTGYRLNDFYTVELTIGQSVGSFSSSTLLFGSLLVEPFPEWRYSPFFSLGLGRFRNTPSATLVGGVETNSNMANAGLGINIYLTRSFVLRGDYNRHVVFVDANRINQYNELSLGVSIFFH
jgi:hypothetical protein